MPRALLQEDALAIARRAGGGWELCDACLGRLVWRLETGVGNASRGEVLRTHLDLPEVPPAGCEVCRGSLEEADHLAELVLDALEPYEFDHYLVGTRVDQDVEEAEEALWAELGLEDTESVGGELNRRIGKIVGERTGTEVEFGKPHVTAIVDTRFDVVDVEAAPRFLFGRYRKLERGIPQTRWPCRRCEGRGCLECDDTGKRYPTSVEELVAHVPVERAGAEGASFHGAGREDVDARCLGTGRPFILELTRPRRRNLDLAELRRAIDDHAGGRVEVTDLRWTTRDEVAHLKGHRGDKRYLAHVRFAEPVPEEKLISATGVFTGRVVAQRTPSRVAHRRADKVRERRVHGMDVESHEGANARLRIAGDAGLYIKELVHGDDGRTQPSLRTVLDVDAEVVDLDVLDVAYEPPDPADDTKE